MTKTLKKFCFILSILLLNAYGCLCSNVHQNRVRFTPIKRLKHLEYSQSDYSVTGQTIKLNYASPAARTSLKIISESNEEENFTFSPLRKYLELSTFFTSFDTWIYRYFFYFLKILTPHTKSRFFSSSNTHILLQVIRI